MDCNPPRLLQIGEPKRQTLPRDAAVFRRISAGHSGAVIHGAEPGSLRRQQRAMDSHANILLLADARSRHPCFGDTADYIVDYVADYTSPFACFRKPGKL